MHRVVNRRHKFGHCQLIIIIILLLSLFIYLNCCEYSKARSYTVVMSERHLKTGDVNPPVNPDRPRIYSMRFCPDAHRVFLVLKAKGIDHEVVNIDLVEKPEFFTDLNPYGDVPTFQYRGEVVADALPIVELLEDLFPEKPVTARDPFQRARDKEAIFRFEKISPLVKTISLGPKDEETEKKFLSAIINFQRLLTERKTPFFGGDESGLVDFMIWPWFVYMSDTVLEPVPDLKAWTSRMRSVPAVKATEIPKEDYQKFLASFQSGRPTFDV